MNSYQMVLHRPVETAIDNSKSKPHGSYVREAYRNGLAMQDTHGYNPYKFGIVGAGDSHNTATSYSQSNYFGDHGLTDATPEARLSGKVLSGMTIVQTGTSGLGGVWAEENTRASIFDAMKRKETFGTSGVRIKVRMFGGWGYAPEDLNSKDWVKTGYAKGVPMGGDLPSSKGQAPTFIVWAVKDPKDGNLDRIQIVKGWSKSGQSFEKVYDVVWSDNRQPDPQTGKIPAVGNTVDVKNASYTNTIGAVELKKVWTDPEFDPKLNAFYYARVIQIPTPRWSTYDAKKLGVAPPTTVPSSIQERAWTSPIWYTPEKQNALQGTKQGLTVADLQRKGAVELNNAQLSKLLTGKSVWMRNTVTGGRYESVYEKNGHLLIAHVGKTAIPETDADKLSATYSIQNDKVVSTIGNTPFDMTFYKIGETYYAARSSEFGYANYRIMTDPSGDLTALNRGEAKEPRMARPKLASLK
jgi:Protein of unknown function (DUF3604)